MALPPFQDLVDAHATTVHRFLVAYVGPSDADDCFQEACIAALRAYPELSHAGNLRAWMMRIAERKALDHLRARGRRPVPVEELPDQVAPTVDEPGDLTLSRIWTRVRELPDKQRSAVFLRSAADLSYGEVAAALDCSEAAARRSVHEGLKRLREEVAA